MCTKIDEEPKTRNDTPDWAIRRTGPDWRPSLQQFHEGLVVAFGDGDGVQALVVQLGLGIAAGVFADEVHVLGVEEIGPMAAHKTVTGQAFLQGAHGRTEGEAAHAAVFQIDDVHVIVFRLDVKDRVRGHHQLEALLLVIETEKPLFIYGRRQLHLAVEHIGLHRQGEDGKGEDQDGRHVQHALAHDRKIGMLRQVGDAERNGGEEPAEHRLPHAP